MSNILQYFLKILLSKRVIYREGEVKKMEIFHSLEMATMARAVPG